MEVGALVKKQFGQFPLVLSGRDMKGSPSIRIGNFERRATFDEGGRDSRPSPSRGNVQCGLSVTIDDGDRHTTVKQLVNLVEFSLFGSEEKMVGRRATGRQEEHSTEESKWSGEHRLPS